VRPVDLLDASPSLPTAVVSPELTSSVWGCCQAYSLTQPGRGIHVARGEPFEGLCRGIDPAVRHKCSDTRPTAAATVAFSAYDA
jgi:hypothetical protein